MLELFQRTSRSSLLRLLLCGAFSLRHVLPFHPHLDEKKLLVVRPALPGQAILRGRTPASLQKFLQSRFAIRVREPLAALFQSVLKQDPAQCFARRAQPRIEINPCNNYFESIRQERLLLSAAGFFFAASHA